MVLVTNSWRMWLVGFLASLAIFGVVYFTVIKPDTNAANQAVKTGLQQSQQALGQAQQALNSASGQSGASAAQSAAGAAQSGGSSSQASQLSSQASQTLSKAAKLTSCVAAAGTDASKLAGCQAKFGQ